MTNTVHLSAVIGTVCTIAGVALLGGDGAAWQGRDDCAVVTLPSNDLVRIDFDAEATSEQRAAAVQAAEIYDPEIAASPEGAPIDLPSYAAARRYQIETGGITSQTFGPLLTDRDTRAIIGRTIQSIDIGIVTAPVNFKSPAGFVSLTREQLVAIATEIAAHVQACFDAEQAVLAGIGGGNLETAVAIDAAFAAELA